MLFLGIMIKGIFNYTENRLKRKRRWKKKQLKDLTILQEKKL
jgi:hypothetical protein